MTTYFTDDFNRADGALSAPWIPTQSGSGLQITSHTIGGSGDACSLYLPGASGLTYPNTANIAVSVTIATLGGSNNISDQISLYVRGSNEALDIVYRARLLGTGVLAIFDPVALTTTIATTTLSQPQVGDVLTFQAYENILAYYVNGGLVLSVSDDKVSKGDYVGVSINESAPSTTLDNFALSAPTSLSVVADPNTIHPANNYLICQRTGFKVKVSEGLKEEWNGTQVRAKSWEPRQVLDLMRNRAERSTPSNSPEGADTFIENRYPSGVSINDLDA